MTAARQSFAPRGILAGVLATLASRWLLGRALRASFARLVRELNAGDYSLLLRGYHPDAVLTFADGDHRWSGTHRGRDAIERFLQNFTRAGLRGEVRDIFFSGPLWNMTLLVRFDDEARGPDGALLYENRTVLLLRARWGRIVDQQDFYLDTGRILELERRLQELQIAPV